MVNKYVIYFSSFLSGWIRFEALVGLSICWISYLDGGLSSWPVLAHIDWIFERVILQESIKGYCRLLEEAVREARVSPMPLAHTSLSGHMQNLGLLFCKPLWTAPFLLFRLLSRCSPASMVYTAQHRRCRS